MNGKIFVDRIGKYATHIVIFFAGTFFPGISFKLSESHLHAWRISVDGFRSDSAYAGTKDDCLIRNFKETINKAREAGLNGDTQVGKFSQLLNTHKIDPKVLTKDQITRAGKS